VTTNGKFKAQQLRVGDFCLVQIGRRQLHAEVIHRGKTYSSPIGVRYHDGKEQWFDSRTGFSAIVGGARLVGGKWIAL
jgi:hypothetical protein